VAALSANFRRPMKIRLAGLIEANDIVADGISRLGDQPEHVRRNDSATALVTNHRLQ